MLAEHCLDEAFSPTEVTNQERLAWVTHGLVLYVRSSLETIWPQVLSSLDMFLSSTLPERLQWFQFSHEIGWVPLNSETQKLFRSTLQTQARRRPFWHLEIVNRIEAPDLSFEFADIHTTLGHERASFIRLRLPLTTESNFTLDLARRIAVLIPFWFGTAGYQFSFSEAGREAAFDQIWAWARRYWGVEVVHSRTGTWDALKGIIGINWLTFIGDPFIVGRLQGTISDTHAENAVRVWQVGNGVALQAGTRSTLGDINSFEDVSAYAAASKLVAEDLVKDPLPFPGMFTDHKSTSAWIRRFLEPGKWLAPLTI